MEHRQLGFDTGPVERGQRNRYQSETETNSSIDDAHVVHNIELVAYSAVSDSISHLVAIEWYLKNRIVIPGLIKLPQNMLKAEVLSSFFIVFHREFFRLICTLECGRPRSAGTSKTWIFTPSTWSTTEHPKLGTAFRRNTDTCLRRQHEISSRLLHLGKYLYYCTITYSVKIFDHHAKVNNEILTRAVYYRCSNFMRHKTCMIHPKILDKYGVPYQKVVQVKS